MSLERMNCCGHFTHVYGDQMNRTHNPGCTGRVEKRIGRRVWSAIERAARLRRDKN